MKTAVSIPDEVFAQVEEIRRRTGRSRSDLYSQALAEYVAGHAPDRVTEAMDNAIDAIQGPTDAFVREASRRALARLDW